MKTFKRVFIFLLALITVILIHYYLPQRDVVQVVNTDVKRMDISTGSPFWDRPDAGTDRQTTRDVRPKIKRAFTAMKIPGGHFLFI